MFKIMRWQMCLNNYLALWSYNLNCAAMILLVAPNFSIFEAAHLNQPLLLL